LILEGLNLKVVTIGENGITENDILTHDAKTPDPTLHLKLILMSGPEYPVALGVIRDVEAETYNDAITKQIADVQAKSSVKTFDDLIDSVEQWEM